MCEIHADQVQVCILLCWAHADHGQEPVQHCSAIAANKIIILYCKILQLFNYKSGILKGLWVLGDFQLFPSILNIKIRVILIFSHLNLLTFPVLESSLPVVTVEIRGIMVIILKATLNRIILKSLC